MKTCSYEALSEQQLIEAGDILPSLQFFYCWISFPLFFPCAECHQDVYWVIWEASHSVMGFRKNPQSHILFDRPKQDELMTYEKWQIGHVVNCETNSTEYRLSKTSAMYKKGYVMSLFILFLEKSTLSPTYK